MPTAPRSPSPAQPVLYAVLVIRAFASDTLTRRVLAAIDGLPREYIVSITYGSAPSWWAFLFIRQRVMIVVDFPSDRMRAAWVEAQPPNGVAAPPGPLA